MDGQGMLPRIFRETYGEAFLFPFDHARTLPAMQEFGQANMTALAAGAGGLFLAGVVNLLLGALVRRAVQEKVHLPPWKIFSRAMHYGRFVWPAIAALCFLPVFPQLLFFAGLTGQRHSRLIPAVLAGCAIGIWVTLLH